MTKEALKLALEALKWSKPHADSEITYNEAITAIKEALAQPEPNYKKALEVWLDKTEWVQETVKPHELGMHRADVLKQRIKEVLAQPEQDSCYGYKGKCNRVMSDGNPCGLNAPCPDCGLSLIDCPKPQPWEKFCDSNCVWTDHHPDCKLAQPEQEPVAWATREDFYFELNRRVDRMREEMMIKTVTMRCKEYDLALPIVDMYGGHIVVGQVSFPPQRLPLTDEEIILIVAECAASHQHTDIHFARAIERAHGIKELV